MSVGLWPRVRRGQINENSYSGTLTGERKQQPRDGVKVRHIFESLSQEKVNLASHGLDCWMERVA